MKTRIEMNQGVAHLLLDDPGKKVNTLGNEMLSELSLALDKLAGDEAVKAVVIRSPKPGGFLAGADLEELRAIAISGHAHAGGLEAAKFGQALMNKLEDFPKPVLAAIHGPCLGGGLELALGCHARLAAQDPATKLGLPELSLGIVPGFGGTYRLPRTIGLVRALEAILTSKPFDARKAYKQGLVDDLCAPEQLAEVAQQMALGMAAGPALAARFARRREATLPLAMKVMQWPGARLIALRQARAQVMEKTRGQYPAPLRFLALLKDHYGRGRQRHLEAEAEALADTLASPVAANLVNIFFLGQEAKKQAGAGKARPVRNAAVVGSGFMGSGIAIPLIDKAGVRTILKDSNPAMLGRALKKAWDYQSKRVKRRQTEALTADQKFRLLSASTGIEGFNRLDLVIEAVPEVMALKKTVFAELEAVLQPQAILASNTSTLPISQLSAQAAHPERFIGMHFFSPAEVMPLVEIIPGEKTSPDNIATTVELALKMGKTPVVVKDSPGFLVNRILLPYALEAAQMVQEGVPVEQVDKAALDFGMPVGPIRLVGEVGIEVMLKAMHLIQGSFSGHMTVPAWVEHPELARAFAKGADGKWKVEGRLVESWVGKPDPKYPAADIQDRLFHAMLNEAARCMEEGLVASCGLLDLAMVMGTGFPPFRGGPLREADARGLTQVLSRGRSLARTYHPRLEPPALIVRMGTQNEKFYS